MVPVSKRRYPMVGQAIGAAPHDNIAALQPNALRPVATVLAAEEKHRRQPERDRNYRRRQIAFVLVAMQR